MNRKASLRFSILRGVVAILISLLIAALLIFISAEGNSFLEKLGATMEALKYMIVRPIIAGNGAFATKSFTDILAGMIPTIFTGLATCVMFSANQFNLGTEGGIMLGAFVSALVAIYIPMGAGVHVVMAVLAGGIAVAVMMLIPGLLKAKLGVSEMVCSLMLNYVIMYAVKFLMNAYFADKSKGQVQSLTFQSTAAVPELVSNGSKLTWGFILALIFVVITSLFMFRTKWGYAIRMIGINQEFAKYSGIKVTGIIVASQVIGGLLAGIGGGVEMLGRNTFFSWNALPGYGWTGITIACIAGNNPILVPFTALFMAYLNKGCNLMSTYCGVPSQLIDIIQGVIFVFFAAEQFLSGYRQKLVVRSAQQEIKEMEGKEGKKDE